jgi:hypothetical protein
MKISFINEYTSSVHPCQALDRGGQGCCILSFAACGGEKRKRSEDTSRSAKGQPPLGTLLLSDLATALRGGQIKKQTRRS